MLSKEYFLFEVYYNINSIDKTWLDIELNGYEKWSLSQVNKEIYALRAMIIIK